MGNISIEKMSMPFNLITSAECLERERRNLDNTLRQQILLLIRNARQEGFELGLKAGQELSERRSDNGRRMETP